jgi:hypothetical protein
MTFFESIQVVSCTCEMNDRSALEINELGKILIGSESLEPVYGSIKKGPYK